MKKIALLAVFALGFALALAAIRSEASTGVPNHGSYSSNGVPNNGAQTVHFTAAYQNIIGGFFTCAGERISKTAPRPFTKDSEDCTETDLSTFPPGTLRWQPILRRERRFILLVKRLRRKFCEPGHSDRH